MRNVTLIPVDFDPFGGVYDDTKTTEQAMRDRLTFLQNMEAAGKAPLVTPPEMESDANFPDRVIDPDQLSNKAFGHYTPGDQTSYGAGKYKVYSPSAVGHNFVDQLKDFKPSLDQ